VTKIVGFGDSFVYGNELCDNHDGHRAWPGLVAQSLGCKYETKALAGCGNEHIAQQIYSYFSDHSTQDTLAVINWTWSMRWDFYLTDLSQWIALGPTCVPSKIENLVGLQQAQQLIAFYNDHIGRSDIWNKFRSLQAIYAAQCWMKKYGVNSIQTFMDRSMLAIFCGNRLDHYDAYKDPDWPMIDTEEQIPTLPMYIQEEIAQDYEKTQVPRYIQTLQSEIRPTLETFEGLTFLEWSHHNQFPVTELLHPLEEAHLAASALWQHRYAKALGITND
jgi:hypothetical protein